MATTQKMTQTVIEAGKFYTISAANGKVMEVADFNMDNGAKIQLWDNANVEWQQWGFVAAGDGVYRLKNRFTGKMLDLNMGGVSDGTNLSQGQRQLLAIARAAVADPPVLILDEATSSIDTRTEILVQQGMDSLMKGRTTFVIAHRLSTVKNSDCIMVLENGSIIERGTHKQLLEEKGKYYQLYTGRT